VLYYRSPGVLRFLRTTLISLQLVPADGRLPSNISCMVAFKLDGRLIPLQQPVQLKQYSSDPGFYAIGLQGWGRLLKEVDTTANCCRWLPQGTAHGTSNTGLAAGLVVVNLKTSAPPASEQPILQPEHTHQQANARQGQGHSSGWGRICKDSLNTRVQQSCRQSRGSQAQHAEGKGVSRKQVAIHGTNKRRLGVEPDPHEAVKRLKAGIRPQAAAAAAGAGTQQGTGKQQLCASAKEQIAGTSIGKASAECHKPQPGLMSPPQHPAAGISQPRWDHRSQATRGGGKRC
jgi:hypothetical protein